MAARIPNMTALLGLLAVAGYRNRDKIGALLGKAQEALSRADHNRTPRRQPMPGTDRELETAFGEQQAGGTVSGAINDLVERFRAAGEGETAESWVARGPNRPVRPDGLERALGPDLLDELTVRTGLERAEILERLSDGLPRAVDDFTPQGRVPSSDEAGRMR